MPKLLFILSLALLTPNVSEACECIGVQGPFVQRGDKGIVAVARVVSVRSGNSTQVPAADVEITEGFLNAKSGSRVTIYTAFGNCAYPLRNGEEYVLATDFVKAADGFWGNIPPRSQAVSTCGRTRMLNSPEGQRMLAAIREEVRRVRAR